MIGDKEEPKQLRYGVIAQELQEIAPDLVSDDNTEDHYLAVNYTGLIPHLINVVKKQDKRIAELEARIDKLTALCERLAEQVSDNK